MSICLAVYIWFWFFIWCIFLLLIYKKDLDKFFNFIKTAWTKHAKYYQESQWKLQFYTYFIQKVIIYQLGCVYSILKMFRQTKVWLSYKFQFYSFQCATLCKCIVHSFLSLKYNIKDYYYENKRCFIGGDRCFYHKKWYPSFFNQDWTMDI